MWQGGGCRNAVVWVAASLQRLCATAIVHPCTSCLLCWFRIVRNLGQALSRILAFAVVGVAASVHRQPFVPLHHATALCGCLYASLHNDSVRPPSCILCTFMNALWALRHCNCGRSFYKTSVPYPHCASSPPSTKKSRDMPVCDNEMWRGGVSNCGRWGRCIVQRLCATAIVHQCTSLAKGEVLSPTKIRATTGGIVTPPSPHPASALPKPHCPLPRTKLASLVKGRWLDGKAQALTLLHLLAIRPPFLYCKLFCRQDGGIVTPPSLPAAPKKAPR